eukprot:4351576-Amphidinium_carterae.1
MIHHHHHHHDRCLESKLLPQQCRSFDDLHGTINVWEPNPPSKTLLSIYHPANLLGSLSN